MLNIKDFIVAATIALATLAIGTLFVALGKLVYSLFIIIGIGELASGFFALLVMLFSFMAGAVPIIDKIEENSRRLPW